MNTSFIDYAPRTPPQGWVLSYTGSLMATLKLLGELPKLPWGIVIVFLVAGLIYTLVHTAIRRANASSTTETKRER